MGETTSARKFFVSGRVQGVFFRWFTQDAARSLGLKGYVRNIVDGRVEVVAEGTDDAIDLLLGKLHEGPELAVVTGVEEIEVDPTGSFEEFSITY